MFGIAKDSDILAAVQRGHAADSAHVEAFSLGRHGGPSLEILKPDWEDHKSLWNRQLADKFATHLCAGKPEYEDSKEQIAEHFVNRIHTLQRILNGRLPKTEEENLAEVEANYQQEQEALLHGKRIRGRLISVSRYRFFFFFGCI